jgi:small nuclear ribonucleoprotein (snRNP)-like protein
MEPELQTWQTLLGQNIVVDTNSSYIYIGKLVKADSSFITLEEVDVHDQKEGYSTKEKYVMEAKKFGIKKNRKSVFIRQDQIISVSRFDDIIEY